MEGMLLELLDKNKVDSENSTSAYNALYRIYKSGLLTEKEFSAFLKEFVTHAECAYDIHGDLSRLMV